MNSKMEIKEQDLSQWMNETWTIYASQKYKNKLLRLHINGYGTFRVTHGEKVIYCGNQMTHAIAAWKKV